MVRVKVYIPLYKNYMLKIGIECENLEDPKSRWGVGQITLNLLKEYANNPELQKNFKLYLYFKKRVPDDKFLKTPVFVKRVLGFPSFNIFYHILMPLRAMMDRLDWMFFPAYMLPPLYLGKSVVMLTDDVYHEYKYGNLPFRYKLAYRLFTNWAAKFATKIMAISETSKREVAKLYGINPKKIFVNYLGVGSAFAEATARLQYKEGSYLLYIGQMFPRRHARETILAFKKILSEFPDLKLIMVGKDKYPPIGRAGNLSIIDELIKQVNKELGNEKIIHYDYIEKREEIGKLYAGAKALIYVSDHEAFGLPPLEALASGVPPIVMDNELGHELFGQYAVYVKSGNVENIAEAMRQVINESGPSITLRASRLEFAKKYNWKSFADRFFENIK